MPYVSLYVGLGVCAHDKDEVVTATFSKVEIQNALTTTKPPVLSDRHDWPHLRRAGDTERAQLVAGWA